MSEGKESSKRWEALDELRGFSVFALIVFHAFYGFQNAPEFLKHAVGAGYHFADFIAPLFLFAVGLSYYLSFKKRFEAEGALKTLWHFLFRYLLLIAFGMIGGCLVNQGLVFRWGVLEMIGLSGIISLPLILISPIKRIAVAVSLIGIWHVMLNFYGFSKIVAGYSMGGPYAAIAWSAIVLVASAISEYRKSNDWLDYSIFLLFVGAGFLFSGDIISAFSPMSKVLVSASYVVFSVGLAVISLMIFSVKEVLGISIKPLAVLGKNALVIYMLSALTNLLLICLLPGSLSLYYLMAICALMLLAFGWLAKKLDDKKIYLKV